MATLIPLQPLEGEPVSRPFSPASPAQRKDKQQERKGAGPPPRSRTAAPQPLWADLMESNGEDVAGQLRCCLCNREETPHRKHRSQDKAISSSVFMPSWKEVNKIDTNMTVECCLGVKYLWIKGEKAELQDLKSKKKWNCSFRCLSLPPSGGPSTSFSSLHEVLLQVSVLLESFCLEWTKQMWRWWVLSSTLGVFPHLMCLVSWILENNKR